MAQTAIAVFTHENLATVLQQGGSHGWHVNLSRAREREFLVCAQNRRHEEFREPGAEHRAIFLIGRISRITRSSKRPGYWFIEISEFAELRIPDAWNQRNPIQYTTLDVLGIDPVGLPPFRPLAAGAGGGFGELAAPAVLPPRQWRPTGPPRSAVKGETREMGVGEARDRFDAILDQIDRIPDLPEPFDPLAWDEHGLPR